MGGTKGEFPLLFGEWQGVDSLPTLKIGRRRAKAFGKQAKTIARFDEGQLQMHIVDRRPPSD